MRLGMISKDKIDDRPDVAPSTLERFAKARERDAARDPALKPGLSARARACAAVSSWRRLAFTAPNIISPAARAGQGPDRGGARFRRGDRQPRRRVRARMVAFAGDGRSKSHRGSIVGDT